MAAATTVFEGVIEFIASEAEFTPRTVQTTEERTKLVYAVKVYVDGDPDEALKALRGSVLRYDDPTEPVGLEDWEALE